MTAQSGLPLQTGQSSAQESLRLANYYRQLTEGELLALANERDQLTEAAQQALSVEFLSRGLKMPASTSAPAPDRVPLPKIPDTEDEYAEDRRLEQIRTVWSEGDARRLQAVLDAWGIPFYLGEEKATSVDDVISNFNEGIPVMVMRVGVPWALEAMKNYFPQDERTEPSYADAGEIRMACPRCGSADVLFQELLGEKFRWTCDSCANTWEDEGLV